MLIIKLHQYPCPLQALLLLSCPQRIETNVWVGMRDLTCPGGKTLLFGPVVLMEGKGEGKVTPQMSSVGLSPHSPFQGGCLAPSLNLADCLSYYCWLRNSIYSLKHIRFYHRTRQLDHNSIFLVLGFALTQSGTITGKKCIEGQSSKLFLDSFDKLI